MIGRHCDTGMQKPSLVQRIPITMKLTVILVCGCNQISAPDLLELNRRPQSGQNANGPSFLLLRRPRTRFAYDFPTPCLPARCSKKIASFVRPSFFPLPRHGFKLHLLTRTPFAQLLECTMGMMFCYAPPEQLQNQPNSQRTLL